MRRLKMGTTYANEQEKLASSLVFIPIKHFSLAFS